MYEIKPQNMPLPGWHGHRNMLTTNISKKLKPLINAAYDSCCLLIGWIRCNNETRTMLIMEYTYRPWVSNLWPRFLLYSGNLWTDQLLYRYLLFLERSGLVCLVKFNTFFIQYNRKWLIYDIHTMHSHVTCFCMKQESYSQNHRIGHFS